MAHGVLFDVDGTLVDTNYLHTVAWAEAFRSFGHNVPMRRLHSLIGQGSGTLVKTVLGREHEELVDAHTDFYARWLQQVPVFDRAADLLIRCKNSGLVVVLATSASAHEADHLRAALGVDEAIDHVITADDVDAAKPEPDVVHAAVDQGGLRPEDCLFVGDSVWDVIAARRAGVETICVLTGGTCADDLREAGATTLYDDVASLVRDFDESPLGRLARAGAG